jgi:hypothetical protein
MGEESEIDEEKRRSRMKDHDLKKDLQRNPKSKVQINQLSIPWNKSFL